MAISPQMLVEFILLGPMDDRRQLQDSPILGDVWIEFAKKPSSSADLLITPYKTQSAGRLAAYISKEVAGLGLERSKDDQAKIAYLQGVVAARLFFYEVLRIAIPITPWWESRSIAEVITGYTKKPDKLLAGIEVVLAWAKSAKAVTDDVRDAGTQALGNLNGLDRSLILAGCIVAARETASDLVDALAKIHAEDVLTALNKLIKDIGRDQKLRQKAESKNEVVANKTDKSRKTKGDKAEGRDPLVWQISLNRPASPSLDRSIPAVKADAARTLFTVNCNEISWAIVDTGIDSSHPVFEGRVLKTFDFTRIRDVVSIDNLHAFTSAQKAAFDQRVHDLCEGRDLDVEQAKDNLTKLAEDADNDRPIFWQLVEPFVTIAAPDSPKSVHGTHVAGIVGANAKTDELRKKGYRDGMCPDIKLYDFRVLARSVRDTEFAVIAALQFIRYLNDRHNFISIHGVNLSLSIPHDIRNYACGRTPICDECERLISSGVVVVAAAGNRGYNRFETKDGGYEGYTAFSITDPGNADGVITVGATHRFWPHTYGVSFFSSRGPTGDGRPKPDLVAPGERIESALPEGGWGQLDGTSMAAPHVSGAAAMLMARYSELIGQPKRIKEILCKSATDLGRERSFQGHGMLDVLRAFQSI